MAGRSRAGGARSTKRKSRGERPGARAARGRRRGSDSGQTVASFVRSLTEKERVALEVRDQLYTGSWQRMREDLEARAAGKPHVFRLMSRIEEDLEIIRKLSTFEHREGINLSDYLEEGR